MNSECWDKLRQFERAYDICRKRIMSRYQLTAIEVDVLLFLANNPRYNTAAMISSIRRIPKSHVSLAVSLLHEKNYLHKEEDPTNKRRVHLIIKEQAQPIIKYGLEQQEQFSNAIMKGFTPNEIELINGFAKRISENLCEYEQSVL